MATSDHETKAEREEREERLRYYTRMRPGGASAREVDKMAEAIEIIIPKLRNIHEIERLSDRFEMQAVHIDPYAEAPASKRRKKKGKKS